MQGELTDAEGRDTAKIPSCRSKQPTTTITNTKDLTIYTNTKDERRVNCPLRYEYLLELRTTSDVTGSTLWYRLLQENWESMISNLNCYRWWDFIKTTLVNVH
jgi:hypothetical protein